jgi:hypothetical protein
LLNAPIKLGLNTAVAMRDETVLSTGPVPTGNPLHWFHLTTTTGQLVRSFALVRGTIPQHAHLPSRLVASNDGQTFWALPTDGAPQGYVLEQWSYEGRLLRTIERRVLWTRPSIGSDRLRQLFPTFKMLRIDAEGLILGFADFQRPALEARVEPS